jgi:hypothetical protein
MGDVTLHPPVLLVVVAFSRYDAALSWARQRVEEVYGPVALASEPMDFVETEYYEPTMGRGLRKTFWATENLVDPATLADVKLETGRWEIEYAAGSGHDEPRPLNLDPGYLTLGKFVLASTKDHAHRIYLRDGIYAEVTLHYHRRRWSPRDWTFPDYHRNDYHTFLDRCREYYKRRLASP